MLHPVFKKPSLPPAFNHPARAGIIPNLVRKEHLLNAISLDTFSVMAMRMVAMPLTGYLIVFLGVWPISIIRAILVVIPIFLLRLVKTPLNPPLLKEQAITENLIAGFRYLRSNTIVLGLFLLNALPMLTGRATQDFLPVVAEDILNMGAVGYGYLLGASGLGSLIALIVLTMLTYYRGKLKLLLGASLISGVALLGFSASRWFFLSFPLLVVIGVMNTAFMSIISTLVQGFIPNEMRGRVMSWREITQGLSPVGAITLGAIAQNTGVPFAYGVLGGIRLLNALLLVVLLPKFRSLEQEK
ncbi:MAG: MFS transporter [Chloroflexi bacterium]|nr:MFS transporter [Chloroflexota bacterium]